MAGTPDWEEIRDLFAKPYWVPTAAATETEPATSPKITGDYWIMKMKGYRIDLTDYDQVCAQSGPIYDAVSTRTMPHTKKDFEYWPDEALVKFDKWRKRGFPWANKPAA